MAGCNSCQVPMATRLKLSKRSEEPQVDATSYRSVVGSLRYLVNTRPDLAFSVGYVSRFLEEPRKDHLAAVKQILRYVEGTKSWGLRYEKGKKRVQLTVSAILISLAMLMRGRARHASFFFLSGSPIT